MNSTTLANGSSVVPRLAKGLSGLYNALPIEILHVLVKIGDPQAIPAIEEYQKEIEREGKRSYIHSKVEVAVEESLYKLKKKKLTPR